jgi:hypothetical protein
VPEIVCGPAAVSGKLAVVDVPPLSFVTVLTSVSVDPKSLLPIVQVALPPKASVTVLPLPPLVQDHHSGVAARVVSLRL